MFDETTIQKLKYYVYLLIDPETDEPFYVGKGVDNRVFAHVKCALKEEIPNNKYDEIRRIVKDGNQVKHLIVRHGLNENTALEIEASLIDTFKYLPKFNDFIKGNIQGGIKSIEKGLMTTDEVIRLHNAENLNEIGHNCVIININGTYERGSGEDAIYKATKEIWRMDPEKLEEIKFVLSEYKGLIVEVFEVSEWYPKERGFRPGTKKYGQFYIGYGFNGAVAKDKIRDAYVNKSISHKKKPGSANVVRYNL